MGIFYTILETIFPVYCIACHKEGSNLCLKCLAECGPAERESAEWIYPIYDYRHPIIKKSIWLLKYKNKKRIAKVFAMSLNEKITETLGELILLENFKDPFLIPIPLSKSRIKERGYNQSQLICQYINKLNKELKPIYNVLVKTKDVEHQARLHDKRERIKNIANSFGTQKEFLIKGKNIILIDDVTTTGATLTEAKKVLKQAGAKKVIAFTLAH